MAKAKIHNVRKALSDWKKEHGIESTDGEVLAAINNAYEQCGRAMFIEAQEVLNRKASEWPEQTKRTKALNDRFGVETPMDETVRVFTEVYMTEGPAFFNACRKKYKGGGT